MKLSNWFKMRMGLLIHPQFYSNPVLAIWRRMLWKIYAQRQPLVKFHTEYGFHVEGQPQDIGVGSLFYRGQYEWSELKLWCQLLTRSNLVVLDVGANFGIYSLVTAAYCRQKGLVGTRIFGFEPNPIECAKFQRNVDLNCFSEIKVLPLAISDRTGVSCMAIPPDGLGVFGHLLSNNEGIANHDKVMEVETINLDSWCDIHGIERINLIKIDVEGYELNVLRGAKNLLASQRIDILLMEIGHGQWREALDVLRHYGYTINLIARDSSLQHFEEGSLTSWDNVIAYSK